MEELTTEVTAEDIKNGVEDKFGVVYSRDGKRLLKCNNQKLRSYEIIDGTLTICNSALKYCDCLKQIIIPESVIEIGSSVFGYCVALQKITIPNSVKLIGDDVFYNCESLIQITLSNSLTTIGAEAFWGCKSLQEVILPDSVKEIGDFAFRGCLSLKQINIPDSVTAVGNNVFYQCNALQTDITSDLVHRIKENISSPRIQSVFTTNLKITKMRIKNFRAFIDEEVCFDDFNCIIGKNDVGKSTVFAALEWFFDVDKKLNEQDLNSKNDYFLEKLTQYGTFFTVSVEVYFSGVPFIFEKNDKDFFDKDDCICVKKEMTSSIEDGKETSNVRYYLKKYIFNQKKDRTFSDCPIIENINKLNQLSGLLQNEIHNLVVEYGVEWQEHWFCLKLINSYKFCFYTSHTSLSDYLNDLFQIKFSETIEDTKSRMAKDLSEMLAGNNLAEKIKFKKNETVDLFPNDNVLLCSGNIPLKNRGEGFQLQIKNAIFKLLTDLKSQNKNVIFAFEEPETHLHPSAQIEMYETIKKMSENPNYQVFITTHSPYIVKQLAKENIQPIVVKRDENLKVSTISKLDERVLPYISMNEINYIAFDEPSIEYHIELFGYIAQQIEKDAGGVDIWLFNNNLADRKYDFYQVNSKTGQLFPDEKRGGFQHSDKTLPYCVRNQIDHPNEKNKQYENRDYIRCSIDIMRNSIFNNPDIFQKKV